MLEKFIIFSDSLSVLQSIQTQESKNPFVTGVLKQLHEIAELNKEVIFCWIPSHRNIRGNEKADIAAKEAVSKPVSSLFKIPATDHIPRIKSYIYSQWQRRWDRLIGNKLHSVMPQIQKYSSGLSCRKSDVLISRMRLGHTRLTHSFLMERKTPPTCDLCQLDDLLTVEHILLRCNALNNIRRNYFTANNLKDLFDNVTSSTIIDFIKDIGVYNKL